MQEKKQNISPIKQRILDFADKLSMSKREFYARTGISRGTLESPTGITEDTITKFFATFQEADPLFILTGKQNSDKPPGEECCEKCKLKDELIESLRQQLLDKQKLIEYLEEYNSPAGTGQKRKASA